MLTVGQTTVFNDHGTPKVAVVTKCNDNGTVDLHVLATTHRAISRSDGAVEGTALDQGASMDWAAGAPPVLTSIAQEPAATHHPDATKQPEGEARVTRAGRNPKVIRPDGSSSDPKAS